MKFISRIFAPTNNRRLNELLGFLLCVSALLLFLALASFSPLDPSFNSASVLTGSPVARESVGIIRALGADPMLQIFSMAAFLLPVFALGLGIRWFRSRKVVSPIAKLLGGIWLLMFVPALLALLPGHSRWFGGPPLEGLFGRVFGDFLIHYLNLIGAYIISTSMLAVALYFCTAFSFTQARVWATTRFSFAIALRDRWKDWQEDRLRKKMQKELDKRRAAKPVVQTQMVQARPTATAEQVMSEPRKTAIESFADEQPAAVTRPTQVDSAQPAVEVTERADSLTKPKTTMPRVAGGFQLPPNSLLHRAPGQQGVGSAGLKMLEHGL